MRISIERLTAALNEVRRGCSDLPVLAIPWIHMKHPIHPVQRELIADGFMTGAVMSKTKQAWDVGRWRGAIVLAGRFGLCVLYAAYVAMRLLQLRFNLRSELAAMKRERFDVVAKSWRFKVVPGDDGYDFYYGDLQKRLEERGVRMLILSGDPKGKNWYAFAPPNGSTAGPRQLPELCLVPLFAPFLMAIRQLRVSVRLRRMAATARDPLIRRVAIRASQDGLCRRILPVGLYYWIGMAAVRTWHPKAFVALYEGYGWEQCAWQGAKAGDPSCHTVGYQHTILLRHNLALLEAQEEGDPYTRPDVVLCLGRRTQAMLRPSHRRSTLIVFGTFRRPSESHGFRRPCPQRPSVLVLPEGWVEEEKLLFNTAMRVAQRLTEYRFIFRCHPHLPFEEIREHLENDPASLPNVEVSSGRSIEDDFARSSVILYRGSSSVLYAVLHGLKPVYLHDDGYQEIDPLFELNDWRVRACSIEELEQVLRQYAETDPNVAVKAWQAAVDYVDTYTVPVDRSSIDRFLSAVGFG